MGKSHCRGLVLYAVILANGDVGLPASSLLRQGLDPGEMAGKGP